MMSAVWRGTRSTTPTRFRVGRSISLTMGMNCTCEQWPKQKIGSSWYYFNEKGVRQQGKWITDGDKKYYAMPEGTLRVGWLSFGSTYYYCNSNAEIVTGIYVVDGVGYQFDENGIRRKAETGWYEDEATGNRYYVMPDGTYRVGWLSFGSTHYYCGSNGAIVYGKQKIDGKWYYFNEEGVRQSSAWYEDADGRYYIRRARLFQEQFHGEGLRGRRPREYGAHENGRLRGGGYFAVSQLQYLLCIHVFCNGNVMIYVNNMCRRAYFLFDGTRSLRFYCYICYGKSFTNNL